MKIGLPQYTSKDYYVWAIIILPLTIVMNSVIFGTRYFGNGIMFTGATLITALAFTIDFVLCGFVAVLLKNRFPEESQTGRRLSLMIIVFLLVTGIFLLLLFRGYESIHFRGYTFNEKGFVWSYVVLGIANIFLTFLHEGIDRFEKWKVNLRETEELRLAYRQSQLEGLKSQVNPHFLFNSLNSLSSLITEDEDKAEKFLNEMSKVYRYLLRNDEDTLVPLQTELTFLQSYLFLLETRYGDGLNIRMDIGEEEKNKFVPPLSLQLVIENAFSQNIVSKTMPLTIRISTREEAGMITVCNTIQPKSISGEADTESGLDNLVKKYQLLNQSKVIIEDNDRQRCIRIPLILKKEEAPL